MVLLGELVKVDFLDRFLMDIYRPLIFQSKLNVSHCVFHVGVPYS